jgi:hypothetical protein
LIVQPDDVHLTGHRTFKEHELHTHAV